MSAIQKLRSKTGLITIFIGAALLAFIITDLDPQMFSAITGNNSVIAKINGEKQEYDAYYDVFERFQRQLPADASDMQQQGIYNQAWEAFVAQTVYEDVYKRTGVGKFNPWLNIIGISQSEFEDIMIGENIAPEVYMADIFKNPQTNMFDKQILIQTLSNLSFIRTEYPDFYQEWLQFEIGMHQKILENKINAIVGKALLPTNLEIEFGVLEAEKVVDIEFVRIDYSRIADSLVTVSDAEIQNYYKNHRNDARFEQEESVTFEYITFEIQPTFEDIKRTEQTVYNLKDGFINARNLISFLNVNSDLKHDPSYHKRGTLPPTIEAFAFEGEINSITDVYFENNMYKVAKISDIRYAADSARVRHILAAGPDAMQLIDSLKTVLENKQASFTDLVTQYSADEASIPNGGVYEWFTEGQMVQSFQDSSFFGEKGKYYIVPSQFGVHLIEILDQGPKSKRVQVQYLARTVQYSTETRRNVYSKAILFASENQSKEDFDNSVAQSTDLVKRIADRTTPNQRTLPGLRDSRDVIRWAHKNKNKVGQVSDIFNCGDAFVIAIVTEVHNKGVKPLDVVREEIKTILITDKKKEYIAQQIASKNPTSIQAIADMFSVTVGESQNISFASASANNVGREPKVLATASLMEPGKLSSPIMGEVGAFVIVVSDVRTDEFVNSDMILTRMQMSRRFLPNSIFPYLKEKADVQDFRIKFF